MLRWGLVPFWAKDPSIGNRMINARMETVTEKPAFRRAFAKRRCLLPADGYYEWYATEQQTKAGKPLKQPFYIHPADGSVMAMAGLYEIWKDPTRDDDDPERFRWTCTVLTTTAEDAVGHIHDRMPLLVEPERRAEWLDAERRRRPRPRGCWCRRHPGGSRPTRCRPQVNNVRHNGPELAEPLPPEDVPDGVAEHVDGGRRDRDPHLGHPARRRPAARRPGPQPAAPPSSSSTAPAAAPTPPTSSPSRTPCRRRGSP